MVCYRSNQRTHRSLWVALGFLCCALIVCATIVQVGTYTPTVNRFARIAHFAILLTLSSNHPLRSLYRIAYMS